MNDKRVILGYRETPVASGTPMPRHDSDALTAIASGAFLIGAVQRHSPSAQGDSMTQLSTVAVDCPRCDVKIMCTLKIEKSDLSVPDLADKFAEHYREAGHVKAEHLTATPSPEVVQALSEFADVGITPDDLVARAARRMGLAVHSAQR